MRLYNKLTDKLAGQWLWLYNNSYTGYSFMTKLLRFGSALRKWNSHVFTTSFIVTFLLLLVAATAGNPRWINLPYFSKHQCVSLFGSSVIYLSVVLIIRFSSNLIFDSANKYIDNNPQIFGMFEDTSDEI